MRNLILVGHPDLSQASLANRTIVACLKNQLPDAEIVDLTKTNPDFKIDVPTEQERLKQAQNIVFQFPLYWYSLPAILKAYLDTVFTHGFAHGSTAVLGCKNLIPQTPPD